jgi:hypothetical protein
VLSYSGNPIERVFISELLHFPTQKDSFLTSPPHPYGSSFTPNFNIPNCTTLHLQKRPAFIPIDMCRYYLVTHICGCRVMTVWEDCDLSRKHDVCTYAPCAAHFHHEEKIETSIENKSRMQKRLLVRILRGWEEWREVRSSLFFFFFFFLHWS